MKISEITKDTLRSYLRLDDTSFDDEIKWCLESAKSYVLNQTALSKEDGDKIPELAIAVMVMASDYFENHLYHQGGVGANVKTNQAVESIIAMHRMNLL